MEKHSLMNGSIMFRQGNRINVRSKKYTGKKSPGLDFVQVLGDDIFIGGCFGQL